MIRVKADSVYLDEAGVDVIRVGVCGRQRELHPRLVIYRQTHTYTHTHLLKGQVFETIKAGFTITVLHKYSISLC